MFRGLTVDLGGAMRVNVRCRGHRVMTGVAPWMASAKAAQGEPAAAERAVQTNGFERVVRAGRGESTPKTEGAEEGGQHGGEDDLIKPDGANEHCLQPLHFVRFRSPARLSASTRHDSVS